MKTVRILAILMMTVLITGVLGCGPEQNNPIPNWISINQQDLQRSIRVDKFLKDYNADNLLFIELDLTSMRDRVLPIKIQVQFLDEYGAVVESTAAESVELRYGTPLTYKKATYSDTVVDARVIISNP